VMRKPIGLVLALLLTLSSVAYAGYDSRASELREILKKKQLTDDKERDVLTKALDEYVKDRQDCLDALVRLIEEANADAKQEQAWTYRIDGCKEEAVQLGNAIKSVSGTPSIDAFNFLAVTQVEEVNFFTKLAQVKVGERRDKITVNGRNVADMSQKLEEKWRYLFDQDNALDEYEKRVVEQVGALIDRAFDESDRPRRTIKERLVSSVQTISGVTKKVGKPIREVLKLGGDEAKLVANAIEVVEKLADSIDAYAKIYLKTNQDYVARSSEYAVLLQSERGGIFVLFGGFRRDTEEFLKSNGFDKAKYEYDSARDAMSSWASSTQTSGQRSDADSFAKDVLAKLSNHLVWMEQRFNDFVSRHRGKFFGPIAPDIREALAETRVWEDWNRMIAGKSLDAKARQWRSEANTFFTVSLDGLSSEDQEFLRRLIQERTNALVQALDDAEKLPERFRKDFDRSRQGDDLK
jgi:hypothetical protein